MKFLLSKIKYLFYLTFFLNLFLKFQAEDFSSKNIPDQESQILIESNNQRSDLKNSIFYAEGEVKITSPDKNFIAKSEKAIFFKSSGKIRLIGNVEVITSDSGKIKAGEIIYYLIENKFEAVSDSNQRVNTKFDFNYNQISD